MELRRNNMYVLKNLNLVYEQCKNGITTETKNFDIT